MVRGTLDPTEAIRLAVESFDVYEIEDLTTALLPEYFPNEEDGEAAKTEAAQYFARLLNPKNHRAGLLRISPCHCGDHGWHWDTAAAPGHGVFKGVVFE
jgi:hypothetical protein